MKRLHRCFAFALAIMTAMVMATFTFAAEPNSRVGEEPVDTAISEAIQPRTTTGEYLIRVLNSVYFLNIDNAAHPGQAKEGDAVIIWQYSTNTDERWWIMASVYGGYCFCNQLDASLALNINHVANQCTLHGWWNNLTQGKSDSEAYMNGSRLQLSQWNYQLTNTAYQAGNRCFWTTNGTDYICLSTSDVM